MVRGARARGSGLTTCEVREFRGDLGHLFAGIEGQISCYLPALIPRVRLEFAECYSELHMTERVPRLDP